jgi:uncharacterized protein YjbI with pentapeptide repeats
MAWRTKPEIDLERQQYLAERRAVRPDIDKGIYPFRDENGGIRLKRGDVEWLLATHESGGMRGPVEWDDLDQRRRSGLDLRGAILNDLDLTGLPLSKLQGGLTGSDDRHRQDERRKLAAIHMERSLLTLARMERALLAFARFDGATINGVRFEGADLYHVYLAADQPGDLRGAVFDADSNIARMTLANRDGIGPKMLGVRWGGATLTATEWSSVARLEDEQEARRKRSVEDKDVKSPATRNLDFDRAVQAYRQLATALRSQGLNEDADHFAFRAQVCQRVVLRRQHHFLRYLGSMFLWLVAGYGYKPLRSLFTYLFVVLGFALAYYLLGNNVTPALDPHGALVFSLTSFHGRGFAPGGSLSPDNPLTTLAAIEAVCGLLIEITFIATFTQRFFAR